jgi:hypothetical protein
VRARLNYANVMATVAVFLALGGGAYAVTKLPKNSVGSKQIRNGQVKTRDLGKGSVTPAKIRGGLPAGGNGAAGPPGPAGPAGADGAAGRDGAAHITTMRLVPNSWPIGQVQAPVNPAFVPESVLAGREWTQPPGALDWFFGRFRASASAECQEADEVISYNLRLGNNTTIAKGEIRASQVGSKWYSMAFEPQYAWLAPPTEATERELTFWIGEVCPEGSWTLNELRVDVIRAFG